MKVIDAMLQAELVEEACRTLGMNGGLCSVLREDIRRNAACCLFLSQFAEKACGILTDVHITGLPILGGSLIHAFCGGVLKVPGNGDPVGIPVDVCPFQGAYLTPACTGIQGQENVSLPFQGFLLET